MLVVQGALCNHNRVLGMLYCNVMATKGEWHDCHWFIYVYIYIYINLILNLLTHKTP